jgi:hypothetical protein
MIWVGIGLLSITAWLLHEIENAPVLPWHD